MNQTQSHSYSFGNSGHSRYASAHANSSAFSASANPNEDWTKVSDLAERRRIQNRIAQRNYRKKLKRRLEDLERRAGSSSTSPEQSHVELASPNLNSHTHPPPSKTTTTNRGLQGERRSPEPSLHFEREPLFGRQTPRQLSASPPPPFSYSSSMAGSSDYFCTEPESINYGFPSNSYAENASYQEQYYAGLLPTLSSSMPTPPHKESDPFGDEGLMNPFSMTYASVTGIDVPMAHGYMDFDPHVNATAFFDPSAFHYTFP